MYRAPEKLFEKLPNVVAVMSLKSKRTGIVGSAGSGVQFGIAGPPPIPAPAVPLTPPMPTCPPVPLPPAPGPPPVPLEPPPPLQPVVAINAAVAKSKIEVPVISTARLKDMFASEGKKKCWGQDGAK